MTYATMQNFALAELLKYKHILAIYYPHLWM